MRFIVSVLREIDMSRLVPSMVIAALVAWGCSITPTSIPSRWGAFVLVLAILGLVHLLVIPLSWLQARFSITPGWLPRTWSISRRWYGPGRWVRTIDGQFGTVIEWADDDTDVIWVLVQNQPVQADPNSSDTRTAWRPITDLSPSSPAHPGIEAGAA